MPLAAVAAIGAVGSIAGGAIAAHGAGQAANAQVQGAEYAANLQHQDAQAALAFQQQQYNQAGQFLYPQYQIGLGAQTNLANLLGVLPQGTLNEAIPQFNPITGATVPGGQSGSAQPTYQQPYGGSQRQVSDIPRGGFTPGQSHAGAFNVPGKAPSATIGSLVNPSLGASGSLLQGYPGGPFVSPTAATEQNDPGYQFRLNEGLKALDRGAAARGGLLSGGTLKAEQQYGQDYASNEYQNVYNRALQNYDTNYNAFEQNQANTYNRLANLAGLGQISVQQLSSNGQNFANNATNTLLTSGQQIGNDYQNAAAARASGYAGAANAYGNAISGVGNSLSDYFLLKSLGYS